MTEDPETDPYAPPAAEPVAASSAERPRRVYIIGVLFCFTGGLMLGHMLWSLAKGTLVLNPLALMVPVGIGLLRGKTNSQWSATLWLVLGYCTCLVLIVAELTRPGEIHIRWQGVDWRGQYSGAVLIGCCLLAGGVLAGMHWLLRSARADAYFREKRLEGLRRRIRPPRGPRA